MPIRDLAEYINTTIEEEIVTAYVVLVGQSPVDSVSYSTGHFNIEIEMG